MEKQTGVVLIAAVVVLATVGAVLTFVRAPLERNAAREFSALTVDPSSSSATASALKSSAPVVTDGVLAGQTGPASVASSSKGAAAAASAPGPRVAPTIAAPVDWARYPGTLHVQIQQALQARDGAMAADLARKLRECDVTARQMKPDFIQRQMTAGGDPALSAVKSQVFQSYQRILANCQTVVGDPGQLQLALLDLAVAQGVIGAAVESFHLGQRRPEVLQAVVRDAIAGDVSSLIPVTSHKPSTFGISPDMQRSLRYAFELAADDPDVGALVRRFLSIAESVSVPLAGEAQPRFNHDGLTDGVRVQGQATARQIIERVKAPK